MATYIKPEAIKDASIEGIKIKDNSISSLKIDETVASKNYVDNRLKQVESNAKDIPIEKGTGTYSIIQKGRNNIASGEASIATGSNTKALGLNSHAEGNSTEALGLQSHAEGNETKALGEGSHSEGKGIVSGDYSFSGPIDSDKKVYQVDHTVGLEIGDILIREGDNYAVYIIAIDGNNITFNNTFGPIVNQQLKKTTGSFGAFSHSEGNETITNEHAAHAEGYGTKAFGQNSHAEGEKSQSFGKDSHSEGSYTVAAGDNSHAEGAHSTASGPSSHAEGYETQANSSQSHAEGYGTIIDSDIKFGGMWIGPTASHAEGYLTRVKVQGPQGGFIANGQAAHVEGYMTEAHNLGEHAEGRFNLSHTVTPQDASNPTEIELSQSTLHSVGMGFPDSTEPDNPEKGNRKNAHEIMQDGKHYIYGIGGYDGTNPTNSKDIATYLPNMVNITYEKLCELRTNSQLVPGQQYRITDYTCTTTQENTRSASHQFDIIVTADSTNKLNEEARAIQHTNDKNDYFANSNLSAWKLWYSLDNDTTRFAWADDSLTGDKPNGRGVIYRMIDEFGNDCPYDFKNIQFIRAFNSEMLIWCVTAPISIETKKLCYTFSSKSENNINEDTIFEDMSLIASNNVYSNVIKEYIYINDISKKQILNNNCFFGNNCHNNTLGANCHKNTFSNSCYNNTLGNTCSYNIFGNICYNNILGNFCTHIYLGDFCSNNTFENNCQIIRFVSNASTLLKGKYYQYNHFGNGCKKILFVDKNPDYTNEDLQVQNYNFAQGLQHILSNGSYLIINGEAGFKCDNIVSRDKTNNVYVYCLAEILKKISGFDSAKIE